MPNPSPRFGADEYAHRLTRTRGAMADRGIDTLIVTDPSNMHWLSGYDGWSFYVHQAVVIGPEGDPLWFGRMQDANGAVRTCWMPDDRVIGYPDQYVQSTERHPMDYLAARLRDMGWHRGCIGVELDNYWFTAAAHRSLATHLSTEPVDATALVNWQRLVKSPAELECMRKAARIVEKIHARIFEKIEPGMRKCDLVAEIWDAGLRFDPTLGYGGDYPAIVPLLPSGADAAAPHLTWDDHEMRAGEATFFEVAGVFRRYHCPLSRTIFLGRPTQTFLDAEKAVLDGIEAGLAVARPGARCEEVAAAFFSVLARHGIVKDNRTGYPIGLSYPPDWGERTCSLRPGDRTELQPGMCFHFMTGLWMEDWGLEITESFVVTEGAPECLATVPRQLLVKD